MCTLHNERGQFMKGQIPWNKGTRGVMKPNKTSFKKGENLGNTNGFKKGQVAWNKGQKLGFTPTGAFKKGNTPWNKGLVWEEVRNEGNHEWRGDDVGYSGLHKWVARHLGQSDECEFCEKTGFNGTKIHWANKDHKYQRNLNDWIRLCGPCHRTYDRALRVVEDYT